MENQQIGRNAGTVGGHGLQVIVAFHIKTNWFHGCIAGFNIYSFLKEGGTHCTVCRVDKPRVWRSLSLHELVTLTAAKSLPELAP